MNVPIRTLSPQDADILARTTVTGIVSNGCVERHGLRWRSDALCTWEVSQRSLGHKPEVTIRIDELDLSVVYVELLDGMRKILKATSTQPKYTQGLSLYEHTKLKQKVKALQLKDRLVQMEDEEAFNLRIQYYAELGHADDPVAYRRLIGLRDQLAALRAGGTDSGEASASNPEPDATVTSKKPRKRKASVEQPRADYVPTPETRPDPTHVSTETPQPPAAPSTPEAMPAPALPSFFIKRSFK